MRAVGFMMIRVSKTSQRIIAKENLGLKDPCESHDYGFWKSIRKGKDDFWNCIRFKVGSSEEIRFWENI